jgi:hypothetical protein
MASEESARRRVRTMINFGPIVTMMREEGRNTVTSTVTVTKAEALKVEHC